MILEPIGFKQQVSITVKKYKQKGL